MDRDKQLILSLLSAVEEDSHTTQNSLATRLGVGVGLVNSYMKRVIYKGYVKTKRLERRRLLYLLTPSGIKEKSRLTLEFLQFSYQYMRDFRARILNTLDPHVKAGVKNVVLYGNGEMAELAYLALTELGVTLHAIVDEDHKGEQLLKFTIRDLEWLKADDKHDLVLVLQKPQTSEDQGRLNEILSESSALSENLS